MRLIITAENLGKQYRLGTQQAAYATLRETIANAVRRPDKTRNGNATGTFWALRDINFEIQEGEVVGIIGRNGAGKSTLLRILSRVTEPTTGRVKLRGRVGSLLEVGTGFHPELTGRENIFLNGAILGMKKAEIVRKFDEIVAFAEIEKFIDTPVKRYSSGMYVRLAFAVAAHLDPEILIIDEVLAVGDQQFQRKCLGKIRDVSCRQGRTVLVVSHTMPLILQLVQYCVVLELGLVRYLGPADKAVEIYLNSGSAITSVFFDVANSVRKVEGTQAARIISLKFPRAVPIFGAEEDISFIIQIRAIRKMVKARVSMTVFSSEGIAVGSCFSHPGLIAEAGEEIEATVVLSCPRLAPGAYYCGLAVGKGTHTSGHVDFDIVHETLNFEVCAVPGDDAPSSHWCQQWGRIVFNDLNVKQLRRQSNAV